MSRKFTPKVVTANHLLEGDAIWLTADNSWTRQMCQAELIEDEARAAERLAFAEAQAEMLVGPIWPMRRPVRTAPNPLISAKSSAHAAHQTMPMANR